MLSVATNTPLIINVAAVLKACIFLWPIAYLMWRDALNTDMGYCVANANSQDNTFQLTTVVKK